MWPFGSRDSRPTLIVLPENQDGLAQYRRCVLAVYERFVDGGQPEGRETLSRAFAICTKQLQKYGYLQPGSRRPTMKGLEASILKAADDEHVGKMVRYEQALARARKPEVRRKLDLNDLLRQARASVAKDKLRGAANSLLPVVSQLGSADRVAFGAIQKKATALQRAASQVFSCDTAFGDCDLERPSRGHCLLATMLLQDIVGGKVMEGSVQGIPHYWLRVRGFDIDLTADQFGKRGMVVNKGPLYGKSRVFPRKRGELLENVATNVEANAMYLIFAQRARAQASKRGYGDLLEV